MSRVGPATAVAVGSAGGPRTDRHLAVGENHVVSDPIDTIGGRWEAGLALGLAGLTFAVHDVGHVLSAPYWLDEAWVADSTRAPVSDLPWLTGPTPLGFTALLRLAVFGGEQRARLVPLVLLAVAVVLAYALGRRGPLPRPVGGTLAAVSVLLAPHVLVRNDLKQYAADAVATLALLLLAARAEERPTRRRLLAVALAVPGLMLVSHPALFVGVAVLSGLSLAAVARRRWRRALEVGVAGAVALVGVAVVYAVFDRPHVTSGLTDFWVDYYLPTDRGIGGMWRYVTGRWHGLRRWTNLGPGWLAALLAAAGLWTLARRGQLALAIAGPVLVAEVLVAGAAHRYPLLDQRTSLFGFVALAVVASIGVAGIASVAGRAGRPAAAVVVVAALVAYAWMPLGRYARAATIPPEDARGATAYVDAHLRPADALVVESGAQFGYAYYSGADPGYVRSDSAGTGFAVPSSDAAHRVVLSMDNRSGAALLAGLARARGLLGPGGRVYVLRAHEGADERRTMARIPYLEDRTWPSAAVTVLAATVPLP
jgi:hypothetical protein